MAAALETGCSTFASYDAILRDWHDLLDELGKSRAAELRRAGPRNPAGWWPALRVISCWGGMVECDGFCGRTPTLRFLGRAGNVSDLCGEKLSEAFVAKCFADLWPGGEERPVEAYLLAQSDAHGIPGYHLVVANPVDEKRAQSLDSLLRRNPHYDLARRLGQLRSVCLRVDPNLRVLGKEGDHRRLGDIKPLVLVRE